MSVARFPKLGDFDEDGNEMPVGVKRKATLQMDEMGIKKMRVAPTDTSSEFTWAPKGVDDWLLTSDQTEKFVMGIVDLIIPTSTPPPPTRILVVGAGYSPLAIRLGHRGLNVFATDFGTDPLLYQQQLATDALLPNVYVRPYNMLVPDTTLRAEIILDKSTTDAIIDMHKSVRTGKEAIRRTIEASLNANGIFINISMFPQTMHSVM
jgi:hypothetical protein